MDAPPGDRGSEGCQILSYLPEKMLSFSWNAPPDQPIVRHHAYKTFVVVQFDGHSDDTTRVTLTHLGWPEGEAWDVTFAYFARAWDVVLG